MIYQHSLLSIPKGFCQLYYLLLESDENLRMPFAIFAVKLLILA